MPHLYLDLEAIPVPSEKITEPTFTQKIFRKKPKKSPPITQQIICIGLAIDDNPVQVLSGDEKDILEKYWQIAAKTDLFVGFGIFDYDLKLIWQRSIIHNIKPTIELQYIKATSSPIYDISYEWSKWSGGVGSKISLDNLAKLLNIPSPKTGDVTGKTVAAAFANGRHKSIYDYCARDVEVTRSIYHRLNF